MTPPAPTARRALRSRIAAPTRLRAAAARASAAALFATSSLAGCGGVVPPPAAPLTEPTTMCTAGARDACRDPREVEAMLATAPLEVIASADPPAGRQDAKVLTLAADTARGRVVFRAKWRPNSSAHQLNSPRKELCAHAVQELLLPPEEWVVPPVASRCLPIDVVRARIDPEAQVSFPGGRCVLGFVSYWLEDARDLDQAEDEHLLADDTPLDPETTRRSPSFRRSVADVNLLAHLISHGDSHPDQFVVTGTRAAPSVHLVDNTIAFSHYRNPSLGERWDWSRLHVPAVRRATVERLRALTPADLDRLLVIEQHALEDGLLVPERPGAASPGSEGGIRFVGDRLQIGLTRTELALLRQRVRSVLRRVDEGRLATF